MGWSRENLTETVDFVHAETMKTAHPEFFWVFHATL
jgi:hypothetical protein